MKWWLMDYWLSMGLSVVEINHQWDYSMIDGFWPVWWWLLMDYWVHHWFWPWTVDVLCMDSRHEAVCDVLRSCRDWIRCPQHIHNEKSPVVASQKSAEDIHLAIPGIFRGRWDLESSEFPPHCGPHCTAAAPWDMFWPNPGAIQADLIGFHKEHRCLGINF